MTPRFIDANGLRYPWDMLKLAWYMRRPPRCLAVKSVLVRIQSDGETRAQQAFTM